MKTASVTVPRLLATSFHLPTSFAAMTRSFGSTAGGRGAGGALSGGAPVVDLEAGGALPRVTFRASVAVPRLSPTGETEPGFRLLRISFRSAAEATGSPLTVVITSPGRTPA